MTTSRITQGKEIHPEATIYTASLIGQRKIQQDAFKTNRENGAYVLADGMSHETLGIHAAKAACKAITAQPSHSGFQKAFDDVLKTQRRYNEPNIGTTAALAKLDSHTILLAHTGDTRIYELTHEGILTLLTRDHTLAQHRVDQNQAVTADQHSKLTKFIGTKQPNASYYPKGERGHAQFVKALEDSEMRWPPKITRIDRNQYRAILLCTDGLHRTLSQKQIQAVLNLKEGNPAVRLIERLPKDAYDNATAAVIELTPKK